VAREYRYQPHRVASGLSNVNLINRDCIARLSLTADGDNAVRLEAFDASAGGGLNATVDSRVVMWAPAHETTQIATTMGFATGLTVSCSGTGAEATIYIRDIR